MLFLASIFIFAVPATCSRVCTDLNNFNVTFKWRPKGASVTIHKGKGFLECVKHCFRNSYCKAFTFSTWDGVCALHSDFEMDNYPAAYPGVLISRIDEWVPSYKKLYGQEMASARRGLDCFIEESGKSAYWGTVNVTETGIPCQEWGKQTPHRHKFQDANFENSGETISQGKNYCRIVLGDPENVPWCYTMLEETRWEVCDIPRCLEIKRPEV